MKQAEERKTHTYRYNPDNAKINQKDFNSQKTASDTNPWKIIGIILLSPLILCVGMIAIAGLLVVGFFYLLWELLKAIFFVSLISDILK